MSKRLPKSPDKKSAKKVPKTEGRPDEANSGKMFTLSNAKKNTTNKIPLYTSCI